MEDQLSTALAATSLTDSTKVSRTESLLSLPNELLEHICFQLHPLEVVKCRQLCLRFKQLINGSIELQLRIDLAIDGYLLRHRGNRPAKVVRNFHEKRKGALESMKYVARWEVPFSDQELGQYDICNGIFAQSLGNRSDGGTFKTLVYKELVSPQSQTKGWTHTWGDLGLLATDFSFWVQGDLQILMEPRDEDTCRRIHFRTISTNQPHPKSSAPYIDIFKADCPIWMKCYTASREDRIALRFWDSTGDSRQGAGMVIDCTEAMIIMPYTPATHIEFLSRDEVLLLFNGEEGYGTSLGVYSFPLQRIVCRCQLPFASPPYEARFLTHPDSQIQDNRPAPIAKSFVTDPELNIVVINFRQRRTYPLCCVLSAHLFRKMYTSLLDNHADRNVFEWEEWGPTVTRWLPRRCEPTGTRSIHGCRMLAWGLTAAFISGPHYELRLFLLDFNPRPIRRGITTDTDGDSQVVLIDHETVVKETYTGMEIKSSLPYRVFSNTWLPPVPNCRFDGTTIIRRAQVEYEFYSFLPEEAHGDLENR
ncbi:hypothetical protein CPB86DRAFT_722666 [Serendipita vermifera]|nr:hypothetical protein CPB86DRAFT_722666 [Serendipita vermifera]